MAQISSNQGAVKSSEIIFNNSQSIFSIQPLDNYLKFQTNAAFAVEDLVRRTFFTFMSDDFISWRVNSETLLIPSGKKVKLILTENPQSSNGHTVVVELTGTPFEVFNGATPEANGTVIRLNPNETMFFELDRSVLDSAPQTNGISTVTPTLSFYTENTNPQANLTKQNSGALRIPIAYYIDQPKKLLYWVPQGTIWQGSITSYVGNFFTGQSGVPLGAIVAMHYPDNTFSSPPTDTTITNLLGNGWKLCDGGVINDTSSPFNGQTVPNLNGNGNYIQGSHSYLDTPVSGGGQHITIGSNSLEMPAHSHGMSNTLSNGSHSHATPGGRGYLRRTQPGENKTAKYADNTWPGEPVIMDPDSTPRSDITAGAHHHDLYASGSSSQHNNLPRTFQVVYVMRIR
jgi:hypothetical protein